jgi:hypothetical protein
MVDLSNALLAEIHGRIREASNAQDEQRVQDGIDDLDRVRISRVGKSVHPELNWLQRRWKKHWQAVSCMPRVFIAFESGAASGIACHHPTLSRTLSSSNRRVALLSPPLRFRMCTWDNPVESRLPSRC